MYGHTYSKSMDQPGKVTNPARGQLDRGNEYFPVPVRTRNQLEAYVTLGVHSLQTNMVNQASFSIILRQQLASYLRLSAGSSKLWYCIYLPLRRQQSFYSAGFSWCRKFKFKYKGLQYEPALTAARHSLLRPPIAGSYIHIYI